MPWLGHHQHRWGPAPSGWTCRQVPTGLLTWVLSLIGPGDIPVITDIREGYTLEDYLDPSTYIEALDALCELRYGQATGLRAQDVRAPGRTKRVDDWWVSRHPEPVSHTDIALQALQIVETNEARRLTAGNRKTPLVSLYSKLAGILKLPPAPTA